MATKVIQTGAEVAAYLKSQAAKAGSTAVQGTATSSTTSGGLSPDAVAQFKGIDDYLRTRTTETLNKYLPGFAGVISAGTGALQTFLSNTLPSLIASETATYNQMRATGATMLSGQLPGDVVAQTRRGAAQRGLEGQQAQNLTARDLGLTSLQLQQQGAQILAQASATSTGMANLASSGQQQLASFAAVGKSVASMFSMSPDILATLQSSINSTEAAKYNAQLDYQASMAGIAANQQQAAAKLAADQAQFGAKLAYQKQSDAMAIAQSGFNQQMSGVQASLVAKSQAALNPTLIPWANTVNNTVASTNRQLADFTNNMLSNLGTGNSSYLRTGSLSGVW